MIVPDDMIEACGHVFDGEYDVPYDKPDMVILDIGANIGSFAVWAKYRWPSSTIHCYEPISVNYELLLQNVAEKEKVICHNVAIGEIENEKDKRKKNKTTKKREESKSILL
jgi:FkbM family methyltransferase